MAYFRQIPKLQNMLKLFSREEKWLILINADPDAMASALALRRIMRHKVKDVDIAKINSVTRPDNLAMIRYAHIKMLDYSEEMLTQYDRFALVDSQPEHSPCFMNIPFSILIDHHPILSDYSCLPYVEIKPEYGAVATMMTEYLHALKIRPAKLLAAALQFGIRTDTASFERHFSDIDLRAYTLLSRYSDNSVLSRIVRSEFHLRWLPYFAEACTNMYTLGSGQYSFISRVDNPDLLVVVADFFMRSYEIRWTAICGIYQDKLIIIFRSDGISKDVGYFAAERFSSLGSAGGHKGMARAEIPLANLPEGVDPELFVWQQMKKSSADRGKKGKETLGGVLPSAPELETEEDGSL